MAAISGTSISAANQNAVAQDQFQIEMDRRYEQAAELQKEVDAFDEVRGRMNPVAREIVAFGYAWAPGANTFWKLRTIDELRTEIANLQNPTKVWNPDEGWVRRDLGRRETNWEYEQRRGHALQNNEPIFEVVVTFGAGFAYRAPAAACQAAAKAAGRSAAEEAFMVSWQREVERALAAGRGPAQVTINQQAGRTFQQQVVAAAGATPNTTAMVGTTTSGASYTTIVDGIMQNGVLLEVKGVKYLSYSPQLQAQISIGQAVGGPGNVLVVAPGTTVSGPTITAFGHSAANPTIFRFNPATGVFTPY
jgi:hypothetical protein